MAPAGPKRDLSATPRSWSQIPSRSENFVQERTGERVRLAEGRLRKYSAADPLALSACLCSALRQFAALPEPKRVVRRRSSCTLDCLERDFGCPAHADHKSRKISPQLSWRLMYKRSSPLDIPPNYRRAPLRTAGAAAEASGRKRGASTVPLIEKPSGDVLARVGAAGRNTG